MVWENSRPTLQKTKCFFGSEPRMPLESFTSFMAHATERDFSLSG